MNTLNDDTFGYIFHIMNSWQAIGRLMQLSTNVREWLKQPIEDYCFLYIRRFLYIPYAWQHLTKYQQICLYYTDFIRSKGIGYILTKNGTLLLPSTFANKCLFREVPFNVSKIFYQWGHKRMYFTTINNNTINLYWVNLPIGITLENNSRPFPAIFLEWGNIYRIIYNRLSTTISCYNYSVLDIRRIQKVLQFRGFDLSVSTTFVRSYAGLFKQHHFCIQHNRHIFAGITTDNICYVYNNDDAPIRVITPNSTVIENLTNEGLQTNKLEMIDYPISHHSQNDWEPIYLQSSNTYTSEQEEDHQTEDEPYKDRNLFYELTKEAETYCAPMPNSGTAADLFKLYHERHSSRWIISPSYISLKWNNRKTQHFLSDLSTM